MAIRRDTMSNVDHAWLRMDDPTNLMMITGVLTFSEPLPYERLLETVESRLLPFERFRQRPVLPRGPLGTAYWEPDPDFNITAHVKTVRLPDGSDQEALQQLVSHLMSIPLDKERPLWQYHLVENYQGGSALITRLHHCIADGIALMRVLLSMTDEAAEAAPVQPVPRRRSRPRRRGLLGRAIHQARQTLQVTEGLMMGGLDTLLHPDRVLEAARLGTGGVARLGQILVRWPDPQTVFKGPLVVEKRAVWSQPIALGDVKAVGQVTGGTVNDVLLTAMAGGLRRYLQQRGEAVDGLDFHAVIPVNLRPLDGPIELGNKFGLVFLALPIGVGDVVERLEVLKQRMDELKQSPEAVAVFGLLNAVGMGPVEIENLLVNIFGTKATGIMTNVPGPRQQLYLGGSPLSELMFWVPQSGHLGLGVSIMSYNGQVLLGVATDAGLVPDPERIVDGFHESFAEMMELVEMVRADQSLRSQPAPPADPVAAREPTAHVSPTADKLARCQAMTKSGRQCRNHARPGQRYCHVHQEKM